MAVESVKIPERTSNKPRGSHHADTKSGVCIAFEFHSIRGIQDIRKQSGYVVGVERLHGDARDGLRNTSYDQMANLS